MIPRDDIILITFNFLLISPLSSFPFVCLCVYFFLLFPLCRCRLCLYVDTHSRSDRLPLLGASWAIGVCPVGFIAYRSGYRGVGAVILFVRVCCTDLTCVSPVTSVRVRIDLWAVAKSRCIASTMLMIPFSRLFLLVLSLSLFLRSLLSLDSLLLLAQWKFV